MQSEESKEAPPDIFRMMVEQVKDHAIFMLDPKGYVMSWNEGARLIKGYEASEIIGKHFSVFYPIQDIASDKPEFELKMARELGRYEDEGWRLRKDGSRFWANVVIAPLKNPQGKLSGFAKITRDLTQRKFQEENFQRLLESEERFRLLVDQVKDYAIFMLDARGNVATWNQGARRLKGYSADEIIGKHFSTFYTPADIKKDHPTHELNIATRDGHHQEEGWRIRKDGTRFWASVLLTAIWDKRGNLTGFAKVTKDLTEKRKEEEALRHKTEELEVFAHTISHDLRAPLRGICSYAEILRTDAKILSPEQQSDYLGRILRSAETMNRLINDVLRYCQLGTGNEPEQIICLDETMDQALQMLSADIQNSKAKIEIQRPLPCVRGTPTLMLQILTNLLANGIKFVKTGRTPKVKVYVTKSGDNCEIHVQDSGPGIPEQYRESIFKMFERGAAEHDVVGTGIGLAIVKKATERLGGSISVQSIEGQGSDFIVSLSCPSMTPVNA
jgi:PAS domain S-box-containing protein